MNSVKHMSLITRSLAVKRVTEKLNNLTLTNNAIQDLIRSNETFDIIIYDFSANEAFLGLSHVFKSSSIYFLGTGANFVTNIITRNPAPYSYLPHSFLIFPEKMSTFQRIANTVVSWAFDAGYFTLHLPAQRELYAKHFPGAPAMDEMLKNVSLVIHTTHLTFEPPRPSVPMMVHIGGFHVKEPKPLQDDLKAFLDGATAGAVYISFGSNVKIHEWEQKQQEALVKTVANLPFRVLWKTDLEEDFRFSGRVKTAKWVPQNDVLGKQEKVLVLFFKLTIFSASKC